MKSFKITCAEVNYFEIEVDADSIEEAKAKAKKDINSFEVLDEYTSEWQFNDIKEIGDDEPTDDEMKSSFGTKWHDGL